MGRNWRVTQPTTNTPPQSKIDNETQLKRTTILDILIKNVIGQIITDIYQKPNNTSSSKSHHPKNCITSVSYTLARRILAIKNYTQSYTREDTQQH